MSHEDLEKARAERTAREAEKEAASVARKAQGGERAQRYTNGSGSQRVQGKTRSKAEEQCRSGYSGAKGANAPNMVRIAGLRHNHGKPQWPECGRAVMLQYFTYILRTLDSG